MQSNDQVVSPADVRAEMLRFSPRGYTQLRHILVQLPDAEQSRASTLSKILSGRKHRALVLYLLLLTCWPWLQKNREPLQGKIWTQALSTQKGPTWTGSTLSRAWQDLEQFGLIEKTREERLLRVSPRREDGAADYEAPAGRKDRMNSYFVLPDTFWTDELFATLSLPALVMLLVIAKETNAKTEVWLTYENCEDWYGIKTQSARKGLEDLKTAGLLHRRIEKIKAPLSPTGSTVRMWYSLLGEYSHEGRSQLRQRAAKAHKDNTAATARTSPTPPTSGDEAEDTF